MTIFYPDLSQYDYGRGLRQLADGTVAVIARASFGTNFVDSRYTYWRAEAARVGAVFGAYHWLHDANIDAQAAYCYAAVGDVPVMVDAEDVAGNTGFTRTLTVADITGFVTALRALGGRVGLVYLPHWYWQQHMGSPDLTPLVDLGVGLVNSNYTAYSDSGPGWQPYGHIVPAAWQYTNKLPYGGSTCDFNAFRGTVDEFRALLEGADMPLTPQDLAAIKTTVNGGPGALTIDDLQRWLGDGVDTRNGKSVDVSPRPSLKLILDKLAAVQAAGQPSQDALNAAVLAAMLDARVQKGIGDAIAAHLKVS